MAARSLSDDDLGRLRAIVEALPAHLLPRTLVQIRASKLALLLDEVATTRGDSRRLRAYVEAESAPLDVSDSWLEDDDE